MKVSRGLPSLPLPPHPVLTIGNFDGQHLGHYHLLSKVVDHARARQGTPMVLTFDPHPAQVLSPGSKFTFLTNPEEKLQWFEKIGIEHLVILEFSHALAALSPEEFVFSVLRDGLGTKDIFVGEHFVFGKGRVGTSMTLMQLGGQANMVVHLLSPLVQGKLVISSTRIRRFIQNGCMEDAAQWLGRPYSLSGKVIKGEQRGQVLGYRTANLLLSPTRVIPPDGVYVTRTIWQGKSLDSVSYIGARPTFGGRDKLLEVHLLDKSYPLYGEDIIVSFLKFIRDDKMFGTPEELTERISVDINFAREVLKN